MSAEPSPTPRAVFLSYASQDAEAARRICEALRAIGVEVWFDQNELVGGDAWDAKIRKQISECGLFVPVISANTQARDEGYFRLEWKLAVDRSHLMAHDKAFLLPVVIDATPDAAARVPPEFKNVQWTRLPGGEASEKFCARVKKLLTASAAPATEFAPSASATVGETKSSPPKKSSRAWLVPAALAAVAAVALVVWQPWKKSTSPVAPPAAVSAPSSAAQPLSEARKLMAQALALIDDPDYVRENFRLAEDLCNQALALDKTDAEVWATAARVSQGMDFNAYDRSPQRREQSRSLAERAVRLAPKKIKSSMAVARNFYLNGEYPEAVRLLRDLLAEAPNERLVLRELLHAERANGNDAGAKEMVARIRALPGGDPVALIYEARDLDNRGRFPEGEAIADQLLAESPIGMAYYTKLLLLARYWSDVPATKEFIQKIPPRLLNDDAFAALLAEFWMRAGDSEKALATLSKVSHEMMQEFATYQPKGMLTGWAYAMVGRPAAAQAEWQRALTAVEQRLAAEPNNDNLLGTKATLLAQLGQKTAARETWNLRSELIAAAGIPLNRFSASGGARFSVAMGENEEAISNLLQRWPSMSFATRTTFYSDLRDAPFLAAIRHDPRVEKLIAEHTTALEALRHGEKKPAATAVSLDEKAVAVLPFANLSGDKEQEYFSDGLTEEILNALARERDLRVPGRTSSFSFKGKNSTPAEIASALNVSRLVEGSVQRSGTKVRIRVSLTRVADNASEELGTFTEEFADIFALQDKVARAVVEKLTHRQIASSVEVLTKNNEAYDFYLRGRALQTSAASNAPKAAIFYERAVTLDPTFALAWARLAVTKISLYGGRDNSPETVAAARAAVARALELKPDLPEALLSRGMIAFMDRDFAAAQRDIDRAAALQPPTAELRRMQAALAGSAGNKQESLRLFEEALALDPQDGDNANPLATIYVNLGRFIEADRLYVRAMSIAGLGVGTPFSNRVELRTQWRGAAAALQLAERAAANQATRDLCCFELLLRLGRLDEARKLADEIRRTMVADADANGVQGLSTYFNVLLLQNIGREPWIKSLAEALRTAAMKEFERGNRASQVWLNLLRAEIFLGQRDAALSHLEEWRLGKPLRERNPGVVYNFRGLYAQLGKVDEELALQRDLVSNGFHSGYSLRTDPLLAPLRDDARFQDLMKQEEAWAKALPDPVDP